MDAALLGAQAAPSAAAEADRQRRLWLASVRLQAAAHARMVQDLLHRQAAKSGAPSASLALPPKAASRALAAARQERANRKLAAGAHHGKYEAPAMATATQQASWAVMRSLEAATAKQRRSLSASDGSPPVATAPAGHGAGRHCHNGLPTPPPPPSAVVTAAVGDLHLHSLASLLGRYAPPLAAASSANCDEKTAVAAPPFAVNVAGGSQQSSGGKSSGCTTESSLLAGCSEFSSGGSRQPSPPTAEADLRWLYDASNSAGATVCQPMAAAAPEPAAVVASKRRRSSDVGHGTIPMVESNPTSLRVPTYAPYSKRQRHQEVPAAVLRPTAAPPSQSPLWTSLQLTLAATKSAGGGGVTGPMLERQSSFGSSCVSSATLSSGVEARGKTSVMVDKGAKTVEVDAKRRKTALTTASVWDAETDASGLDLTLRL
eukprot:SM000083S22756  [mRNA]  locus=s83:329009:331121:- [translate_table: standard]